MIITDTHKAKDPGKKAAHEHRDEHTPDVSSIVTNGSAVKSAHGLPTAWQQTQVQFPGPTLDGS